MGRHRDRRSRARARASSRVLFARRERRRVAGVAEGAPDRRRHAPDLERRRHHQLRDARARQPAARATTRETLAGGRIIVRRARPGEELVTLDGTRRELDPADLVIADAERAIGLAGVMGGENTEVSEATTSVRARDGELRAAHRAAQRRAPSHALREPDALGEGRRLHARADRGELRHGAARRARRCALDGRERGARRSACAAADRLPPRVRERGARARGAGGRAARAARAARLLGGAATGPWSRRRGARATCGATSTSSRRWRASGSSRCRRRCPCARRCSAG